MLRAGEDLSELPGIGEDLAGKIAAIVETGEFHLLESLKRELPGDLGSHGVGGLVDLFRQRLRSGKTKDVIDAVLLAPCHRLGAHVMPVAAKQDARFRPALADMPHQPAQMGANLDARRRVAGPQDHCDRAAPLRVIDMDRQEAALIVMCVEQGQLLMACATSHVSSMSSVIVDGGVS
jgi:hypothetical protein